MSTITQAQYDKICEAIDSAKNDDRSLDTDEYASTVLDALGITIETTPGELTLRVPTTRKVKDGEVGGLIYGTGALAWASWWGPVEAKTVDGVAGYTFTHDGEDSDEGSFDQETWVSEQAIVDAAGRFLGEGRGGEDARDMLTDSLGYADAVAADTILQYAVLGEAIFG